MANRVFRGHDVAALERGEARLHTLLTYPGFEYEWYRLGWLDGQVVATVFVWPFKLRYGSIEIPTGGIASVSTHPDYRRNGYASQVMNDARQYMVERGDPLALLQTGVDGFYTPLGYHNVWPNYALEFSAEAAANLEAPLSMRPATSAAGMAALYEQEWGHRVAMIRPPELWQWRMENGTDVQVVEDNGAIVGYATDLAGDQSEVVVSTPAAAKTIMAAAGRLRQAANQDTVRWGIAADDRLIYDARRFLNPVVYTYHASQRGWMGSIINPVQLRDILLPEIMAVSGFDDVVLDIQSDAVTIRRDVITIQFDHRDFLPLLFGSIPPSTFPVQKDAAELLSALFPPRSSQLAQWDWF